LEDESAEQQHKNKNLQVQCYCCINANMENDPGKRRKIGYISSQEPENPEIFLTNASQQ